MRQFGVVALAKQAAEQFPYGGKKTIDYGCKCARLATNNRERVQMFFLDQGKLIQW